MARLKTDRRLLIESYLNDTDDTDWLDLGYHDRREMHRIYSLVYSMRRQGYPIYKIDIDHDNRVVWVLKVGGNEDA